jgi:polar amino acid transport system substrate-binding protein
LEENKMQRLKLFGLTAVIIASLLAACGAKQPVNKLEAIKQKGEMVVGTSADYPPFEYVDSAGNIIGFDIELLNEVAKGMGIKVKLVDMPFDSLVAAVQEGKIDLSVSAFNYTEERDKNVDFTEAYYSAKDKFMVIDTFTGTIAAAEDFAKSKIGVGNGTVQEGWVTENLVDKGLMPADNLFHYDRADQAALDVKAGRIDTYMGDNAVIDALIKQLGGLKVAYEAELSSGPMMMIVPEGAKELKAALDEQIKKLNESGFTTELAVKHMGGGE